MNLTWKNRGRVSSSCDESRHSGFKFPVVKLQTNALKQPLDVAGNNEFRRVSYPGAVRRAEVMLLRASLAEANTALIACRTVGPPRYLWCPIHSR